MSVWRIGLLLLALSGLRAETLTLATYNVENYGPADRVTEDGYHRDYPKPESEKRALRAVIVALNADVLALEEMGSAAYLDELRRDLKGTGLDYPYAVLLDADDADRHVALLSKRPLKSVVKHTDLAFTYFGEKTKVKRGLLEVTIAATGGDVTIFAVHLKSRISDRADDPLSATRRASEAVAVRDRVLRRFPEPANEHFVLLGDCNDGKTSRPLEALAKRGKTEIANILPVADSRGETWTHYYQKEETYTHVDQVLVSAALRAFVRGATARVYDGPGVREASDHRPVSVVLDLPEKK